MVDLNVSQRDAVRHVNGPLLVLAGAGSGKTRVITYKIIHLIKRCGFEPRQIAAVTFTNKAAREMKERLKKLVPGKDIRGIRTSTFHTLGLNILRQEYQKLGYRKGFSIFDNQDSIALLGQLMKKSNDNEADQVNEIYHQISRWKGAFVTPEKAMAGAYDGDTKTDLCTAAGLYEQYSHHLLTYNALDFDDLIMQPVQLFLQEPDTLEKWRGRIRYLLVDEYQDTNTSQYELVKLLTGKQGAMTIVGDDDQSIYGWRGAQPENLTLLTKDFPQLRVIKLEQNYRSSSNILRAANHLIAHNSHVFEKRLWCDLGQGDHLRVMQAKDTDDEAEKVITRIHHQHLVKGKPYGHFAVLFRGNHQSRPFERVLRERTIPYSLSGGTSFFSYTEVKDIMAYLRLIANPDDDNAFLRVVNTPRRGIGPATVEKLTIYAGERGHSLLNAGSELGFAQRISDHSRMKVQGFCRWLGTLSERALREEPLPILKDLLSDIDYPQWLEDMGVEPRAMERRMNNIVELTDWIGKIQHKEEQEASLAKVVQKLMLYDIMERKEEEKTDDHVHLMTLHAAKGLEFPHVFMVGMEENLLPHRNNIEQENIEEERRLAYVGITRAQQTLTFCHTEARKRYGDIEISEPSRFLSELPQDILEFEAAPKNPTVSKAEGRQTLASLRALLDTQ